MLCVWVSARPLFPRPDSQPTAQLTQLGSGCGLRRPSLSQPCSYRQRCRSQSTPNIFRLQQSQPATEHRTRKQRSYVYSSRAEAKAVSGHLVVYAYQASQSGGGGSDGRPRGGRGEYGGTGGEGWHSRHIIAAALFAGLGVFVIWVLDQNDALPGQSLQLLPTQHHRVSLIIPALNEAAILPTTLYQLQTLQPAVHEIIVVDGGSHDGTAQLARSAGCRVVHSSKGRAAQMNRGAAAATGEILCFVHADSQPPSSLVAEARALLSHPRTVVGGFRTNICTADNQKLRFMTAHHLLKTHYLPGLVRPLDYVRGLRCLFGDQTLFCRAVDFASVSGFAEQLPIMEDAELCLRMHLAGPAAYAGRRQHRRGRVFQIMSPSAQTSGRRLAAWGNVHATYVHFRIGLAWYCGASPQQLLDLYHKCYTDAYR